MREEVNNQRKDEKFRVKNFKMQHDSKNKKNVIKEMKEDKIDNTSTVRRCSTYNNISY